MSDSPDHTGAGGSGSYGNHIFSLQSIAPPLCIQLFSEPRLHMLHIPGLTTSPLRGTVDRSIYRRSFRFVSNSDLEHPPRFPVTIHDYMLSTGSLVKL